MLNLRIFLVIYLLFSQVCTISDFTLASKHKKLKLIYHPWANAVNKYLLSTTSLSYARTNQSSVVNAFSAYFWYRREILKSIFDGRDHRKLLSRNRTDINERGYMRLVHD